MKTENKLPKWNNEGTEPSENLKTVGFQENYKPPANIFNWFWSLCTKAITEIQHNLGLIPYGLLPVEAISEDGVTYTATIEGVDELYNGLEITVVPNTKNTSNALTLNVNGLGDKPIRRPLSFSTYVANSAETNFFYADTPCRLMYHANYPNRVNGVQGNGIWLMAEKQKTSAQDLYGNVPVESGGTGADTAEGARENLGAASSGYGYGEPMVSVGTSSTETYADYCTKIDNILASMPDNTTKLVSATPPYSEAPNFGACAAMLYKGNNAYASLIPVGHSNIYAYGWRMQKKSGIWLPFEWKDPPLETDVEYRTTERFQGLPVYVVKLFVDRVDETAEISLPVGIYSAISINAIYSTATSNGNVVIQNDISTVGYVSATYQRDADIGYLTVNVGSQTIKNLDITVKYLKS